MQYILNAKGYKLIFSIGWILPWQNLAQLEKSNTDLLLYKATDSWSCTEISPEVFSRNEAEKDVKWINVMETTQVKNNNKNVFFHAVYLK